MRDALRSRLNLAADQNTKLEQQLTDPEVLANRDRYRQVTEEHSRLATTVELWRHYRDIEAEIGSLSDLLQSEDPDLQQMANDDQARLQQSLNEIESKIEQHLISADSDDACNVFLEIRAGTGGDEAALFAGDLYRMYHRYAEQNQWKIELLTEHEGEYGGYREIIARIHGEGVYARFKFESGTHRVQRIPKTESQGRIHTSAATVAVLPESDTIDNIEISSDDLRIDRFRASGAGGQHLNKTDSAVRITHLPSGLVIECQDDRSQHRNKTQAMRLMRARLLDLERQQQQEQEATLRRSLIGSGDRSGRIRTYNFPQSRITDHRINLTLHSLQKVLEGELDPLIDALVREDRIKQQTEYADGP